MQEVYFVEFRMKLYVQLMILFVISLIGEGISSFFHLPIPGSIIGLIILFLALQFKWLRTRHVNMVGNFLLANMTILFLPPAVGIMEKFDVIAPYLLPIVLIVFFAAVIDLQPFQKGWSDHTGQNASGHYDDQGHSRQTLQFFCNPHCHSGCH